MRSVLEAADGSGVSAITGVDVTGHASNGGDAHARQAVDLAIGHFALQVLDYRPAISHRLQLRRGAQVAEEFATFLHRAQRQDGAVQGAFGELLLPDGDGTVLFHRDWARSSVLIRYYNGPGLGNGPGEDFLDGLRPPPVDCQPLIETG